MCGKPTDMILHSFKARLVLLSTCLSAAVLLILGWLGLSLIQRIGLARIDRELQALGDAQVRQIQRPEHWARFDESLATIYGEEKRGQFVVRVIGRADRLLYVSPHWPAEVTAGTLALRELAGPPIGPERLLPPDGPPGPRPPGAPNFAPPPLREDVGQRPPLPRFEQRPPGFEPPPHMRLTATRFLTAAADGRTWRFAVMGNETMTLVIGIDLADFQAEVGRLRGAFAVTAPLALLLLAVGGWLLAGQALRPVTVLARVAGDITARGLNRRVPAMRASREFQGLIDVINGMLDRLERSFQQATRFSADAAHELKTPLTILQGQLEQALRSAPDDSPEQRVYAGLLDEVQRLKVIVRKLLLLAQADAGQLTLSLERVDLSREIALLCEDIPLLSPGLTVKTDLTPGGVLMADPDLLRQALQNLIGNALKYNGAGGTIEARLRRQGETLVFSLANTTEAAAHLDRDRIFTRFYRGDTARTRATDGLGLGLSLAREIVRAHGGDLVLDDLRDGWISFTATLPAAES